MSGETLTLGAAGLPAPAPLAYELGDGTQDFLADLPARGLRDVKLATLDMDEE